MTYINFPDPFAKFDKFFVGADTVAAKYADLVEQSTKAIANYPPYNIKKIADNKYVIELAVAGFVKQDIELTLDEGKLIINGKMETVDQLIEDGINQTYLHKGISDRAFTRQFTLADNVEVKGANLLNGMLKVWLESVIPDHKKPKKIDIDDTDSRNQHLEDIM
jgi:molecular chaperone IbpA